MVHHTATKTEDDTIATLSSASDGVEDGIKEEGDDASPWPAAEATRSTLTSTSKLRALCRRYGIPADAYTPRAAGDTPACAPPGERHHDIVVYAHALEAGMRLPLHRFYVKLLRHYGVAPSQLVPNAWRYMAAFVLLCEEAQVKPTVSVFQHLFKFYSHHKCRGWHHFGPCSVLVPGSTSGTRQPLFTGGIPMHSQFWKSKFFVLRSSMPWSCPVSWGEPRDAALRKPSLIDEDIAVVGKLLRTSVATNAPCVPTFLSGRVLPVRGSVSLVREVKREVETNVNDGAKHARKRKASEPAKSLPPYQQGPSTPPGFASGGGERSATRGLLDLVQGAVVEVEGKEKELQAAKHEVAQLKLQLVVARDGLRLLSEKHTEELRAAKSASEAEVARLKEELQHAAAELEAAKLQSPERFVKVMKKMKHQIASLLLEEPEETPSTSSKLTGACSSRARKGH